MLCLMTGATALPVATFEPGEALRTIERERVSVITGPPTLWSSILDHPEQAPPTCRRCASRTSAPHPYPRH